MANKTQFDPVAAAAIAGIRATSRGVDAASEQTGAPQPPNEDTAAESAIEGIHQVSAVSPFNVLARGSGPSPPGGEAAGVPDPLGATDQALPGLPAPTEAFPNPFGGGGGGSPPDPMRQMQDAVNSATGGGGGGGTSGDDELQPSE